MKNTFILITLLALSTTLFSQQIEKKTLIAEGKGNNKNVIQPGGLKTNLSGSMGYLNYDYLPLNNGGFLRRNDFTFQVFDNDQKLVWEKTLESKYGLSNFPEEYTTSNDEFIYFLELAKNGAMRLTRFKIATGEMKTTEASFDKSLDKVVGIFAGSKGFYYLVFKLDGKKETLEYFMGTYAGESLTHSIKPIQLPTDEGGKSISHSMVFERKMVGIWKANDPFSSKVGGIQLTKAFALNTKEVKYVTSETLFLTEDGKVENHIKAKFESGKENYLAVQSLYNETKSELFTAALKKDQVLELMITNKSGNAVVSNKYPLADIQALIPFKNSYAKEIKNPAKITDNIFYDQVNDSYLFVHINIGPNEGFITHFTKDLKVARIDYADWINTLGMPIEFTVGGNVTQRLHQLEWDRYYGSASVLLLNFKNPKLAYLNKSVSYNNALYDAILKYNEGLSAKDVEFAILNTKNNSQVVLVENTLKLSVESLKVK